LRCAHNEQIFNRHKPVLDAMGDQSAYIGKRRAMG
jgi:3-hydroxyisobutyrate dehydrogenase-like beta-hydroxyacid dehydrogenase